MTAKPMGKASPPAQDRGSAACRTSTRAEFNSALLDSMRLMFSTLNRGELAPRVVTAVRESFLADSASMMLPDGAGNLQIAFSEARLPDGMAPAVGAIVRDGVALRVAKSRVPALIAGSVADDDRFAGLTPRDLGSSIVYPLCAENDLLGVLCANRSPERPLYTPADLDSMTVFAGYATLALDNMRLHAELQTRAAALATSQSRLALRDSMAEMGHLVARLSHEVNNPAAAALGNLDFVSAELDQVANTAECSARDRLGECKQATDEAAHSVRRIRDVLARVEHTLRSGILGPERVDVSSLMHDVIAGLRHAIIERARIVTRIEATAPVLGNTGALSLALVAITANAIEAIPAGLASMHAISFSVRPGDHGVQIDISDTGSAVPRRSCCALIAVEIN